VLRIGFELTVIVDPFVAQLRKIFVVEFFNKCYGFHVIDSTLSVELIVLPMTFICYGSVLVVELAEAVHLVIFPLAIVVTSVLEMQYSVT